MQKNVIGTELVPCSLDPLTGWHRDGCCSHDPSDGGMHLICAMMTNEFLSFSLAQGNDLITPMPGYGFPGLTAGDRWCLCTSRWEEARRAGVAPPVVLEATNELVLEVLNRDHVFRHVLESVPPENVR